MGDEVRVKTRGRHVSVTPRIRTRAQLSSLEGIARAAREQLAVEEREKENPTPPGPTSENVERLKEERVKQFLSLSMQDIEMLDAIASGKPPRNSQAILAAIRLKLEHTVSKPATNIKQEGGQAVTVVVQTLGPEEPQGG